jgi:hypothetical protein
MQTRWYPHCESELLYDGLRKAGVSSQFVLVPNGQHGPGLFIDTYFTVMADFFRIESGITEVDSKDGSQPIKFSISQNYPNPFNPSTTIAFTLAERIFVALKIFDSLGREVATLVSEQMPPGTCSRQWNAEGLSSGTYFARLQAGSYIRTKKLIIVK